MGAERSANRELLAIVRTDDCGLVPLRAPSNTGAASTGVISARQPGMARSEEEFRWTSAAPGGHEKLTGGVSPGLYNISRDTSKESGGGVTRRSCGWERRPWYADAEVARDFPIEIANGARLARMIRGQTSNCHRRMQGHGSGPHRSVRPIVESHCRLSRGTEQAGRSGPRCPAS
jgi:hypothetical protein